MSTLLVVSPHLDDAVLSCAGAIFAHARAGGRVVVATVFSEGHDGARRREEDRAALELLGAEALHLGLRDAPERLGLARSHHALVEAPTPDAADVAAVRRALADVVERVQDTRILGPLGVGGHIDHRVVHAALAGRRGLALYEERPYAFLAGATRAALAALLAVLEAAPSAERVRTELDALPHLRAYLGAGDERARSAAWLTARLTALAPAPARDAPRLAGVVTTYDDVVAKEAERAIATYASQLDDLFGARERIAPALRAAARALDAAEPVPHAERTFVLS